MPTTASAYWAMNPMAYAFQTLSVGSYFFQTMSAKACCVQTTHAMAFAFWMQRACFGLYLTDYACQCTCRSQHEATGRMRTRQRWAPQ